MLWIQNPYKPYGSSWSVRLISIHLICMFNINIRINLIRISLTDEVDPYDLRTTPLTHTQHKCVPHMSPMTNQPLQQWTSAPWPSLKLTYRKKKSHGREKIQEKKSSQWKALCTHLFNEEDRRGAFLAFSKNVGCTNNHVGCTLASALKIWVTMWECKMRSLVIFFFFLLLYGLREINF